ncbi:hypothetical protein IKL45_00480, partial [Candidatus Saccharibacteria bacterium]|nr:hypothetical protein [Candidatus Saccharibacteria bacterium]
MELKGLKKASFRITLSVLFLSTACAVFAFQDSYAKCSEPSCSAVESTGATSDTCGRVSCCSNGELKGWRYGAVFFTGGWSNESDWPTWDGSGSLDFTVRGAVFCCQTTNNNAYVSANSISFSDSISLNGSSIERSCSGDKSWGPISSDYLKATVPASTLNKASCDSGNPATCSYTVSVTSTLGSGSAATYSSYFKFYKQKRETATFAKNGISVSSTSMSKSGTTFSGDGKSTKYKVSVTYNIKRTNNTPSSATSGYATKVSETSASYPSSSSATTSALSNGGNYPISVDYNLDIPNGSTKTYCFNIKFDSEVLYLQGSRDSGNFSGTDSACYTFYNPAKNETHFSGAISASGSAGLTVDNTNNTAKGNGLKNSFSITPTYTITRLATDGNPSSASSNYAYAAATANNDSNYPSSSAYNTGGLAKGGSKADTASASAITLNIGNTATRCFYLRYDSYVLYYDSTRDSGNFAGYTKKCFTITNPPAYYTATFGGTVNGTAKATTSGTLDAHDKLARTSSDTMGVIDHATRITGNTSDPYSNGRFNDTTYPSSDQYTATFTHTVTRTDTKPTDTTNNIYAPSAKVSWTVQYSLNGGSWTNYAKTDDRDGNAATVSDETALTDAATKTITVHPKWTLNASNMGQYIYYCQRLSYKTSSIYRSQTPASGA